MVKYFIALLRHKPLFFTSVCIFVVSLAVFYLLITTATTDIRHHAIFTADLIKGRFFPPNFLYFLTVASFTFFSPVIEDILVGSAIVLALVVAAKFWVSAVYAAKSLGISQLQDSKTYLLLLLACSGLLFVFCLPLPGQHWYLGQLPPNIWHNSTTIALMPFAVLLFFYSYNYLNTGNTKLLRPMLGLVLLNIFIKPSFFFCFIVVFPVFCLFRFGLRKRFFRACLPVMVGALVMFAQYMLIYGHSAYEDDSVFAKSAIAVEWLYVWQEFSSNIPLSVINSFALPLLFMLGYPKEFAGDERIRYSLSLLIVGVIIFCTFYETGVRNMNGNFSWQNIVNSYILHLVVLIAFFKLKLRNRLFTKFDKLLVGYFVLEMVVGIAYLIRIPSGGYI